MQLFCNCAARPTPPVEPAAESAAATGTQCEDLSPQWRSDARAYHDVKRPIHPRLRLQRLGIERRVNLRTVATMTKPTRRTPAERSAGQRRRDDAPTCACGSVTDLSWFDEVAAASGKETGVNLGDALWERKHLRAFLPWEKTSLPDVIATPGFPAPCVLPSLRSSKTVWFRRDVLAWVASHWTGPACDPDCSTRAGTSPDAQRPLSADDELEQARLRAPEGWTVERKAGS